MSINFFTNSQENTLINKFENIITYNLNIQYFDALVGYFRNRQFNLQTLRTH